MKAEDLIKELGNLRNYHEVMVVVSDNITNRDHIKKLYSIESVEPHYKLDPVTKKPFKAIQINAFWDEEKQAYIENNPAELAPNTKNTITFYNKRGLAIGVIPMLISMMSHKTRCSLAVDYGIFGWHHYSVSDTFDGMKKFDFLYWIGIKSGWFIIDKQSGMIVCRYN